MCLSDRPNGAQRCTNARKIGPFNSVLEEAPQPSSETTASTMADEAAPAAAAAAPAAPAAAAAAPAAPPVPVTGENGEKLSKKCVHQLRRCGPCGLCIVLLQGGDEEERAACVVGVLADPAIGVCTAVSSRRDKRRSVWRARRLRKRRPGYVAALWERTCQ